MCSYTVYPLRSAERPLPRADNLRRPLRPRRVLLPEAERRRRPRRGNRTVRTDPVREYGRDPTGTGCRGAKRAIRPASGVRVPACSTERSFRRHPRSRPSGPNFIPTTPVPTASYPSRSAETDPAEAVAETAVRPIFPFRPRPPSSTFRGRPNKVPCRSGWRGFPVPIPAYAPKCSSGPGAKPTRDTARPMLRSSSVRRLPNGSTTAAAGTSPIGRTVRHGPPFRGLSSGCSSWTRLRKNA